MTTREKFNDHVLLLTERMQAGDDDAAASLACIVLAWHGFGDGGGGGTPEALPDNVVPLELYRRAA